MLDLEPGPRLADGANNLSPHRRLLVLENVLDVGAHLRALHIRFFLALCRRPAARAPFR